MAKRTIEVDEDAQFIIIMDNGDDTTTAHMRIDEMGEDLVTFVIQMPFMETIAGFEASVEETSELMEKMVHIPNDITGD